MLIDIAGYDMCINVSTDKHKEEGRAQLTINMYIEYRISRGMKNLFCSFPLGALLSSSVVRNLLR